MMRHYAVIGPGDRVIRQINVDDPDDAEPSVPVAEHPCRLLAAPINWGLATATNELRWPDADPAPAWIETATLDELKAAKSAEITRERIATDSDHFTYQVQGGQSLSIRTADKDMFDLLIADARISKGGMPPNWPGGWKAIENSYVPITTVDEWNAFFIAMYDAGIANFNRSQQLKARISAATTPEEVAAITWDMALL